jgi:hypothetical protein
MEREKKTLVTRSIVTDGHFWSGEEREQYYISLAERVSQEQQLGSIST